MIERPECAGWHEPDPTCDGSTSEPVCAYRSRCMLLAKLAGAQTVERVKAACAKYDERALMARLAPAKPAKRPEAPARFTSRLWRSCDPVKVYDRPADRYAHVLPIVDAIAERFARNIGKPLQPEGGALQVGDVYLRFLPGMRGRQVVLYLFTGVNALGLWITRLQMSFDKPRLTAKLNCASAEHPATWTPPAGVALRSWQDRRIMLSLVGIEAEHARETGRFIADLYKAGQIGSEHDPVRRKL